MKDKPDGVHPRMEKYLLRKAFDVPDLDVPEHPYLPESVLWRQKEQFSDGVGYDWVDGLKAHAQRVRQRSTLNPGHKSAARAAASGSVLVACDAVPTLLVCIKMTALVLSTMAMSEVF